MTTILRNDKGTSNWQSYHNAAFAAIGYGFQDESLIQQSIYGKSGYLFQVENSMMDDGIWLENSIGNFRNFIEFSY